MKPDRTNREPPPALREIERDARLLFVKIYDFRPTNSQLKALLEAHHCHSDLRYRRAWQELRALLLGQYRTIVSARRASQARWASHARQWSQWPAEFQQALQARAERQCPAQQQVRSQGRSLARPLPPRRPQPWQVLGLDATTATPAEVKRAYRRLALEHHPDRGGCPERFLEIRQAYEALVSVSVRTPPGRHGP